MKTLLIGLLVLCCGAPSFAQVATRTFAKESLTVSTAAVPFTAATHTPTTGNRAVSALVTVETCAVRVWSDGSTPTATVGHKFNVGDSFTVFGTADISSFRAIRDTSCAVDAVLRVSYRR